MSQRSSLIAAEWRYLVFLNYVVEQTLLTPCLPEGVELDEFNGKLYLSLVGLLTRNMQIGGVDDPFHGEFEQVNLRFYAKRRSDEGLDHGVVFIREIVPDVLQATAARAIYGERFVAMPMRHRISIATDDPRATFEYGFEYEDGWNSVKAVSQGQLRSMQTGSKEEFIAHRLSGFAGRPGGPTSHYRLQHPRWRYWPAAEASLQADVAEVWGREFVPYLHERPDFAFIAAGSAVEVHMPQSGN
jgi:hypothetical protein